MRLSLITQFKIELLLPFTGYRKVLGKKPDIYIYISENIKWMHKEYYVCTASLFELFFRCRLKTALEKQHKEADCEKGSPFLDIELKLSDIYRIQFTYTSTLCVYLIYMCIYICIYIYTYIYIYIHIYAAFKWCFYVIFQYLDALHTKYIYPYIYIYVYI